ncbi:hypothetical protein [Sphaerisporangium aureirubrum]|uniref:Uncharacterized protein n=1 Tax=Sphaerisporangium aureirubrum TaxID=1544736 RepID=A0ABW1N7X3_9ACTN
MRWRFDACQVDTSLSESDAQAPGGAGSALRRDTPKEFDWNDVVDRAAQLRVCCQQWEPPFQCSLDEQGVEKTKGVIDGQASSSLDPIHIADMD